MSSRAIQAAFHLLTSTPPERIRTNARDWERFDSFVDPLRRPKSTAHTIELHAKIMALAEQGMKSVDIALELGVHQVTVSKHRTGKIKSAK